MSKAEPGWHQGLEAVSESSICVTATQTFGLFPVASKESGKLIERWLRCGARGVWSSNHVCWHRWRPKPYLFRHNASPLNIFKQLKLEALERSALPSFLHPVAECFMERTYVNKSNGNANVKESYSFQVLQNLWLKNYTLL